MTAAAEQRKPPREVFPLRMSRSGIVTVEADAAELGVNRSAWIREAIAEKHARQHAAKARTSDRAATKKGNPT